MTSIFSGMSYTEMQYPGWNLDLRYYKTRDAVYPMGIHEACYGCQSDVILIRELAMMLVMDRLSDKPDWHIKVFDDEIVDKWRNEALEWPNQDLWDRFNHFNMDSQDDGIQIYQRNDGVEAPPNILDEKCVEYCIQELRHKAEYFNKTGIVPTLDATFSIAKSDVLVTDELKKSLRDAFSRLQADQISNPDWHPNTNETVQDLVHPSMYPLVYGRSRFFEAEVVGVDDAIDKWAGKGDVIPQGKWGEDSTKREQNVFMWYMRRRIIRGGSDIDKEYWSTVYQWLPSNVKFTKEGGVEFTSYINNLHPTKYKDIYKTVEKLIEKSLPMWDQCLPRYIRYKHQGPGLHSPRILPDFPGDGNPENWNPPEPEPLAPGQKDEEYDEEGFDEEWGQPSRIAKWMKIRDPVFPEPPTFKDSKISYHVEPTQTLRSVFEKTGLQIIVKMASIELTPEKPEYAPGGWHVEGMMNEHIVATALYYLDSENITESHLEFRAQTSGAYLNSEKPWQNVGQGEYMWMGSVYGTSFGAGSGGSAQQKYGTVLTPEGRLLAFPNVFHHRVSGFKLVDKTKPGHRRFIALWLVDPHTRIISTANVPPQQGEWWGEQAFGRQNEGETKMPGEMVQLLLEKGLAKEELSEGMASGKIKVDKKGTLPVEVMEMVRKELGDAMPMSREEAEVHRLKLMGERSGFVVQAREVWRRHSYSFCEH
ncbi:hypothetical protein QBC38DRAFT_536759 [Podospora fimiseda]|uniref:Uncharacterized protein n=1 Tax=Podospora fimiseda TaxID=252190 RepID=A0AAN7BNV9_9PEZI|nr:hypothetical protein QBC38DRAFT_536759 [Podospora fimiseda]